MADEKRSTTHNTLNAPSEAAHKKALAPAAGAAAVPSTPDPRWGVEGCCNGAFVATIGRPGIATEPTGEITVALRCCPGLNPWTPFADNKGVWIQTFDSAGKPSDRSFHLIVLTQ